MDRAGRYRPISARLSARNRRYRLQVVNLAPRLNHKEVYEANNQAYYRDRADQCRNHGSYLPSNYFSEVIDRVVIEMDQAVLLTWFTRPPAAREISRWVIKRHSGHHCRCPFFP